MEAGNRAIRDHAQNGKALYLFTKLPSGKVGFVGEATYLDHDTSPGLDRNGQTRQRIVFKLGLESPATATVAADVRVPIPKAASGNVSLATLRERALAVVPATATPLERRTNVHRRSAAVRDYVLGRANAFVWPLIIIRSPDLWVLTLALSMLSSQLTNDFHILMAAVTLTMMPLLVLYLFAQRYFVQGVTMSGLKG